MTTAAKPSSSTDRSSPVAVGSVKTITGARRAATLLALLPDEAATQVLAHLSDREVAAIGVETARLGAVSADEIESVVTEYLKVAPTEGSLNLGRDRFAKLVKSVRGDGAAALLAQVEHALAPRREIDVSSIDPASLAGLLEAEPPQAIALVLSQLDPKIGAAILAKLGEQVRGQVATRLARLRQVSPDTVDEVLHSLRLKVEGLGPTSGGVEADGMRLLASLMNFMAPENSEGLMEIIAGESAELADEIRERSLVFDDILNVGDRQMASFVQRIDKKTLPLALKGTTQAIQEKFYRGMSGRAGDMLREEMQLLGPVRVADVEKAQATIVSILRKLIEEGAVSMDKGGEGYVT